jgi:hypothetical protein
MGQNLDPVLVKAQERAARQVETRGELRTAQTARNLAKGGTVQHERGLIKREIRERKLAVVDVLLGKPYVCDTMTVTELLSCQPWWGRVRTQRFLHDLEISELRQLKELTERQSNLIVEGLLTRGLVGKL